MITAFEMGWSELENGDLLRAAEDAVDLFITTDQNLRYQQNLADLRLAVLILPTTSWPEIQSHQQEIAAAVAVIRSGECRELHW